MQRERERNGQNHSIQTRDKPFATFAVSDGDFPVGELGLQKEAKRATVNLESLRTGGRGRTETNATM
ncbi:hypothetical protein AV530_004653 [Patagioenas fasciata monilis]|uniref:Uncharacterized protein n=1 Tax=Patagioenas fasciata monilis TaxID=372326 RepID=A0A1V4KHZ7_PATFA|nr:hypothetical protein AV530_004653 [Patagioenas fasciata monilis]